MIWKQDHAEKLGLEQVLELSEAVADFEHMFPNDGPDQTRVVSIAQHVQIANTLAAGDYVELGTLFGLTLKVIHRYMDQTRELVAFDTFAGFDKRDLVTEHLIYANKWREGNFQDTSTERVRKYLGDPRNLELVPGWFPETFGPYKNARWRFAHVDMDLYQPTIVALQLLWPRMVSGGVVMLHDYGCTSFRVDRAVDEFCSAIGVPPVVLPDRHGTAVLRKPF